MSSPQSIEATDAELMIRLAGGDDLALNALMLRWKARVASFLYKMTGHTGTAEELAHETFVKLYQARNRYRAEARFSTYLFAIAANLGRNQARWKKRHPTISLDDNGDDLVTPIEVTDPSPPPDQAASSAEACREVQRAFQVLPLELREAMTLFIYESMSYAEIAAIAGCSAKAAETRIYRARQILKVQLANLRR